MTPEEAIARAGRGDLAPFYLIVGEERVLVERVARALRSAALAEGIAALNEERMTAGETSVERILEAASSAPMMAPRRFVLVRSVERWEPRRDEGDEGAEPAAAAKEPAGRRAAPLDVLAEYAKQPCPSTCLVLLATKLHAGRRIVKEAEKRSCLVRCDPLRAAALPAWITAEARARGHAISRETAARLAEIAGPELGYLEDAVERLSLYVGGGRPIGDDDVDRCVIRVRQSTIWQLLTAIANRRLPQALAMLGEVYDPRDRGLRLLGTVSWSVRQLIKFEAALAAGASPQEAAREAGAAPFKAMELAEQVRSMPRAQLEGWVTFLARADLSLKGSRRPPLAVLESMILEMCR